MRKLILRVNTERNRRWSIFLSVLLAVVAGYFVITVYGSKISSLFRPKTLCKDCNVLLVTIDSCAAQSMPCYGYDRETTPNFCKFASDNIFFTNAFANAPWTLPSHASIFTGLLPTHHKVNKEYIDPLSPSIPLLSDVFHQNGYETIFYMPTYDEILSDTIIYNRGMTKIIENMYKVDDSIDAALAELQTNIQKGKKTFLSLYSSKCHYEYLLGSNKKMFTTDYIPEVPLDMEFKDIVFDDGFYRQLLITSAQNMVKTESADPNLHDFYVYSYEWLVSSGSFENAKNSYADFRKNVRFNTQLFNSQYFAYYFDVKVNPLDTRLMTYLRALYDETLHGVDRGLLAKIAKAFTTTSLRDNTILIITAEHGEEFGEHGVFGHTVLYDGNLKVPFMMHIPGVSKMAIEDAIQSVDIMPTLLDLVGIHHSYTFDGMSLLPLFSGKKLPNRMLIAESYMTPQLTKVLRYDNKKVFVSVTDGVYPYKFYDLDSDPKEQHDLLPQRVGEANEIIETYKKEYDIK